MYQDAAGIGMPLFGHAFSSGQLLTYSIQFHITAYPSCANLDDAFRAISVSCTAEF
jgi:hypothetical protein